MSKRWIKVNEDSVITQVAYLNEDTPEFLNNVDPGNWIQAGDSEVEESRYNYANVGFIYNSELGACHDARPYPSWSLSLETFNYDPPTPMPEDGVDYIWEEDSLSWRTNG